MNLKTVSNFVTSKAARQILTVRKHSPVLLFAAGTVGVVTAAVLACRATLKLDGVLDEFEDTMDLVANVNSPKYSEDDRKQDSIKVYVKTGLRIAQLYGPSVVIGGLSIAALTGSHVILSKRYAGAAAAYALIDKGFRQYRERVVEKYGATTDRELRYGALEREIVEERKDGSLKTKIVKDVVPSNAGDIYARCFDESCRSWNGNHPFSNQFYVQAQQNYANDMLKARGHLFLNEVYDMLGFPHTKEGAIVGWLLGGDGDNYVDFGVFEGDRHSGMRFVLGHTDAIWLDFNVDGIIYDKI